MLVASPWNSIFHRISTLIVFTLCSALCINIQSIDSFMPFTRSNRHSDSQSIFCSSSSSVSAFCLGKLRKMPSHFITALSALGFFVVWPIEVDFFSFLLCRLVSTFVFRYGFSFPFLFYFEATTSTMANAIVCYCHFQLYIGLTLSMRLNRRNIEF